MQASAQCPGMIGLAFYSSPREPVPKHLHTSSTRDVFVQRSRCEAHLNRPVAYLTRSSPLQFPALVTCSFVCKREHQGEYHGIPEPDVVKRCYAQFLEDHPEAREEEVHPRQVGGWWAAE